MRKLFILLMPLLLLTFSFRHPSVRTITGKILDKNGNGIQGVTITGKPTQTRVSSDKEGRYTIAIPGQTCHLVFSYVGYETKEVALTSAETINVTMQLMSSALNEVVVVGYGKQRKEFVTGAARVFSYDQVGTSLSGKVAGIQVNQDSRFYKKGEFNTEAYDAINENGFKKVSDHPLSTFSIDVDAASYSNVRRMINAGKLPPAGAVRIEEMINYFKYDYKTPDSKAPFSINTEIAACPWNTDHRLVLIGLQGKKIATENLPASNLVFLVDVSGSMNDENKLPLVKASLKLLMEQLREQDRVAIVVYAGAAGLVLPSTSGANKTTIKDAIDQLSAGGSTAGGEGIKLAYKIAKENFAEKGNNRVILCTDGDFNVGASSDDEMERLIEAERKTGIYLTVLGYGMGNYKDSKMQKLADKGNGNHAYIDGMAEAKKVLVSEFAGTMFTIAKDVKFQVEFNPAGVAGYRLIGYENRVLNKEDFNDDTKDAGEMGSGHTVTALYEVIPAGVKSPFLKSVDELRYKKEVKHKQALSDELMTVKLRYKEPSDEESKLIQQVVLDTKSDINESSDNLRFAAAVAQFGMLLRKSEFLQTATYSNTIALAKNAGDKDSEGYRKEFIELVRKAAELERKAKDLALADND